MRGPKRDPKIQNKIKDWVEKNPDRMLLLDQFDEIESASDTELLRLHRNIVLNDHKGRYNERHKRILSEIQRRNQKRESEVKR